VDLNWSLFKMCFMHILTQYTRQYVFLRISEDHVVFEHLKSVYSNNSLCIYSLYNECTINRFLRCTEFFYSTVLGEA